MYAIVDIETTGLNHKSDKITEIAIFVHDGIKITGEFSTLINPERNIPNFITNLTGITNEMVTDAPKFYEVAKQIVELTENHIFVAHNVNFDYRFIREEFQQLGYKFKRDLLCTVKMSRKLLPGKPSYSLGSLCSNLHINITNRHRAGGDAIATVKLLEILMAKNACQPGLIQFPAFPTEGINKALDVSIISNLTNETGVYYFYNEDGELIYIGKGSDIQSNVLSHFNNTASRKAMELKGQIADIDYEITGSQLISQILEIDQIRKHNPVFSQPIKPISVPADFGEENFWIIDCGRSMEESSVIAIVNGQYAGYGFIGHDIQVTGTDTLNDCIKASQPSDEINYIINNYLLNHPRTRIIR